MTRTIKFSFYYVIIRFWAPSTRHVIDEINWEESAWQFHDEEKWTDLWSKLVALLQERGWRSRSCLPVRVSHLPRASPAALLDVVVHARKQLAIAPRGRDRPVPPLSLLRRRVWMHLAVRFNAAVRLLRGKQGIQIFQMLPQVLRIQLIFLVRTISFHEWFLEYLYPKRHEVQTMLLVQLWYYISSGLSSMLKEGDSSSIS